MPARCAALRAACSFRKKINSSSSKFEAQITSVPLITNRANFGYPRADLPTRMQTALPKANSYLNVHDLRPRLDQALWYGGWSIAKSQVIFY
ncbi:hypothetical protein J6590_003659 [Homalodisca vitripennis]|nr:hypothetical protein J6590_003659 [Homalodisca vitripennis]